MDHRWKSPPAVALVAGLALFSLPAAAIVGGAMDGEPRDSPAARVDPNAASSPWSGVGSLLVYKQGSSDLRGRYTATAIGAWHVVTAAHVVAGVAPADIRFNLNFGADDSHQLTAAQVHVHPDYVGFVPKAPAGVVHDDLAVIQLASKLPDGIATYPVLSGRIPARSTLTLVGYGAGGDGVNGVTVSGSSSIKRVGRNNADVFVPDDGGSGRIEVYLFDFDGPDSASNRFFVPPPPYQANPRDLTLGNHVEAGLAGGDSGAPAFIAGPDGTWLLAGVNTFVAPGGADAGKFGAIGGGMLLSGYAEWIRSIASVKIVGRTAPLQVPEPNQGLTMAIGAGAIALWLARRSARRARRD